MNKEDVPRVAPAEARRRLDAGRALLVCGYEPDDKFASMHLAGAESLNSLRGRLPRVPQQQEIIFYCA